MTNLLSPDEVYINKTENNNSVKNIKNDICNDIKENIVSSNDYKNPTVPLLLSEKERSNTLRKKSIMLVNKAISTDDNDINNTIYNKNNSYDTDDVIDDFNSKIQIDSDISTSTLTSSSFSKEPSKQPSKQPSKEHSKQPPKDSFVFNIQNRNISLLSSTDDFNKSHKSIPNIPSSRNLNVPSLSELVNIDNPINPINAITVKDKNENNNDSIGNIDKNGEIKETKRNNHSNTSSNSSNHNSRDSSASRSIQDQTSPEKNMLRDETYVSIF